MPFVTIDISFEKDAKAQNSYKVYARIKGISAAYKADREASEQISIDFEKWKELSNTLKSLDARSADTREANKVREFGKSLFQQVVSGKVHTLYRNGRDFANTKGLILRLRLRLEFPELIELPWEILCEDGIFLGLTTAHPRILITRSPTNIGLTKAVEHSSPLQIMIMVAEPTGYPAGAREEKDRISKELRGVEDEGYVSLKEMPGTNTELENIHKNRAIDIFHFIGHGQFNQNTGEGELIIEDTFRNARLISAEKFALSLPGSVRLVFLNACESARGNTYEAYSSIGYLLAKRGYVVIAMQFRISISAAVRFAESFYSEIARNKSVEEAVAEARVRVFTMNDSNPLDWAAPVLYMNSDNGALFAIKAPLVVEDVEDTKTRGGFLPNMADRWRQVPSWTKIIALVAFLVLVAGGTIATQIKETDQGVDLVGYCQSRRYERAIPKTGTVNWECVGGKSEKVDLAQACNKDHNRSDLTPSVDNSGVVSCRTSAGEGFGGIRSNLEEFCQEKGYDTYNNGNCTSPNFSDIDMVRACLWQYGSNAITRPPSYSNSRDPNTWHCHVRALFGLIKI